MLNIHGYVIIERIFITQFIHNILHLLYNSYHIITVSYICSELLILKLKPTLYSFAKNRISIYYFFNKI